ncbi:hypothetical protein IRP63_12265 [Clostridium botulinum]|nr:hypothetical protein IRP63_12265 [Clostridium botulinum]
MVSRTQIREMCKKEYIYLYRSDKNWLFNNLPKKTKSNNHILKVDWNKRDRKVLTLIKATYKELLDEKIPIRITKSSIGKASGLLSILEKNIDKLTMTEKYLSEITETVEEFQIRRCKRIIDNKIHNNEDIKL